MLRAIADLLSSILVLLLKSVGVGVDCSGATQFINKYLLTRIKLDKMFLLFIVSRKYFDSLPKIIRNSNSVWF